MAHGQAENSNGSQSDEADAAVTDAADTDPADMGASIIADNTKNPPDAKTDGRVSAVIVSYFTGPILARCISALQLQPNIDRIIIVDNGNIDGEVDRAVPHEKGDTAFKVISGQGNIGFAAACNLGARAATGDYLLFLNPDAVMEEGGVARLLADGKKLARPWLMGAKLVNVDGSEQQGSRRATLTPWWALVEAAKLYKLAPRHPYFHRFNMHQDACPTTVTPMPTISGACMFLPKEDFDRIDGMDERYFLHVEDIDFCLRFRNQGGGVYFTPHVSVTHFKSSSRANPIRIEARKTASMVRYFRTHFSEPYPAPFLYLVYIAVWVAFGLLFVKRAMIRAISLIKFGLKKGNRGLARASAFANRKNSR